MARIEGLLRPCELVERLKRKVYLSDPMIIFLETGAVYRSSVGEFILGSEISDHWTVLSNSTYPIYRSDNNEYVGTVYRNHLFRPIDRLDWANLTTDFILKTLELVEYARDQRFE